MIVGRKFTGFALFYFVFEGNFQVQAPSNLVPTAFPSKSEWGPTHFLRKSPGNEVEAPRRLIFGGACTRRGLFSEFYGIRISLIFRALGTNHMFCSPQKTWENKLKYGQKISDGHHKTPALSRIGSGMTFRASLYKLTNRSLKDFLLR